MKQGPNNRRSRSRGGGKRHTGGGKGQSFESNGPDVKIRGTAQQLQEKYLGLARDAASFGDRVAAEAFFQYAEHYYRVINPDGGNGAGRPGGRDGRNDRKPAHETGPGTPQPPQAPRALETPAVAATAPAKPENPDTDAAAETPGPAAGTGPDPTPS